MNLFFFGMGYSSIATARTIHESIDRDASIAGTTRSEENIERLADSPYLAGDDYTIADIAIWPWYGGLAKGLLYGAGEFLQVQGYAHVQRWADTIAARPAVRRGRMVNRVWGEPSDQLHERHDASDFDTRTADKMPAPL